MTTLNFKAVANIDVDRIRPMIERHVIADRPLLENKIKSAGRSKKFLFSDKHFIL